MARRQSSLASRPAGLERSISGAVDQIAEALRHNRHDAEDAFQATFLVLVHKIGSLTT